MLILRGKWALQKGSTLLAGWPPAVGSVHYESTMLYKYLSKRPIGYWAEFAVDATTCLDFRLLEARFFSTGGCLSLFFSAGSTIGVTNFFSPKSSNLITMCSSLQERTVPKPNFRCST